jgi:hypothetical protein
METGGRNPNPSRGGRGGRGRGNRGKFRGNPGTLDKNVVLYPPNQVKGTLSNFFEWKECVYNKSKDITKHLHKLLVTDLEPTVMSIVNKGIVTECYRGMSKEDQELVATTKALSAEDIAMIPALDNDDDKRVLRKLWLDTKVRILQDIDHDKPLLFNLIMNTLSLTSKELVKGSLGQYYDLTRADSNVNNLWNAVLVTHNNGYDLVVIYARSVMI